MTTVERLSLDPYTPLDPRDEIFGTPGFPAWVTGFRDTQWAAIVQAYDAFSSGANYVFIDAPTGTGKTLIGETVRRLMAADRSLYICSTKGLQDQFAEDFSEYAKVLKGRSNYPTLDYPEMFKDRWNPLTSEDCTHTREELPACDTCIKLGLVTDPGVTEMHCNYCHPIEKNAYQIAKREALAAPVAVLNTAYLLAEANTVGAMASGLGPGGGPAKFIVADESDTLEGVLMGYATVKINRKWRQRLDLGMPRLKTKEEAWAEWVEDEALPKAKTALARIPKSTRDPRQAKDRRYLDNLVTRLTDLQVSLAAGEEGGWVYTGYERQDKNDHDIEFKPVRVDKIAGDYLWKHGKKWLLMSASLIDPHEQVSSLGIPDDEWEVVSVKGGFPKERRPVVVRPIADMSRRAQQADPDIPHKMAMAVAKICLAHPDDRILVHTVSYDLTTTMLDKVSKVCKGRPMLSYTSGVDRERILREFKATPGAVVFAPSFDRGVDLPHDLCRVQVICKMPFASLGDKQVSRRMYSKDGSLWYSVSTIRTLVQMTGRGMRSRDDYCVTYILDRQFVSNIWAKSKKFLPKWWSEALVFDDRLPKKYVELAAEASVKK